MGKIMKCRTHPAPPPKKKPLGNKVSLFESTAEKNKLCNSPQDKTVSNLFGSSRKVLTSNVTGEINKAPRR